jgi:hypothetical protein
VAQAASAKPIEMEITRRVERTKFERIVFVLTFINWPPPVRRSKTTSPGGGLAITIIGSSPGGKLPLTLSDRRA